MKVRDVCTQRSKILINDQDQDDSCHEQNVSIIKTTKLPDITNEKEVHESESTMKLVGDANENIRIPWSDPDLKEKALKMSH